MTKVSSGTPPPELPKGNEVTTSRGGDFSGIWKAVMAVFTAMAITTVAVGSAEGSRRVIESGPELTACMAIIASLFSAALGKSMAGKEWALTSGTASAITTIAVVALSQIASRITE